MVMTLPPWSKKILAARMRWYCRSQLEGRILITNDKDLQSSSIFSDRFRQGFVSACRGRMRSKGRSRSDGGRRAKGTLERDDRGAGGAGRLLRTEVGPVGHSGSHRFGAAPSTGKVVVHYSGRNGRCPEGGGHDVASVQVCCPYFVMCLILGTALAQGQTWTDIGAAITGANWPVAAGTKQPCTPTSERSASRVARLPCARSMGPLMASAVYATNGSTLRIVVPMGLPEARRWKRVWLRLWDGRCVKIVGSRLWWRGWGWVWLARWERGH